MKTIFLMLSTTILLNILPLLPVKSQNIVYKASVPIYKHYAKHFVVTDNKNENFVTVKDIKGDKILIAQEDSIYLIKSKILKNSQGDVIATRKGKSISFSKNNIVIKEVKKKKNWKYYQDDKLVFEAAYKFNKATRYYDIEAIAYEKSELADNLLKIYIGRFNDHVYFDNTDLSCCITTTSSLLVFALISTLFLL